MFTIVMIITADCMLRKGSCTVPRVAILSSHLNSHNDQAFYDAKYNDDDGTKDDDCPTYGG